MKAAVVGCGAVGARVARQLLAMSTVDEVVLRDTTIERARAVAQALGVSARVDDGLTLRPSVGGCPVSRDARISPVEWRGKPVRRGNVGGEPDRRSRRSVVLSLSDDALAPPARLGKWWAPVFLPRPLCVLARFAAERSTYRRDPRREFGTGGPACARSTIEQLSVPLSTGAKSAWVRRRGWIGTRTVVVSRTGRAR